MNNTLETLSKEIEKKGETLSLHCDRVKARKGWWEKQDKALLQVYFEFGYACALWDVARKGIEECAKEAKQ